MTPRLIKKGTVPPTGRKIVDRSTTLSIREIIKKKIEEREISPTKARKEWKGLFN